MTNGEARNVIVVGVDGSESSKDALRWAAKQAGFTGASLEIVTTWEYPTSFGWAPAWPSDWDPAADATKALAALVEEILGTESDVKVRQVVVEGHPALTLVKAAEDADLLVMGSRGHGEFAGMLIGSVSEYCAMHAPCPVLILRHRED
jgi:nucleotide-binding universal stress UspA family protein